MVPLLIYFLTPNFPKYKEIIKKDKYKVEGNIKKDYIDDVSHRAQPKCILMHDSPY